MQELDKLVTKPLYVPVDSIPKRLRGSPIRIEDVGYSNATDENGYTFTTCYIARSSEILSTQRSRIPGYCNIEMYRPWRGAVDAVIPIDNKLSVLLISN
jgi:hypothetical protein